MKLQRLDHVAITVSDMDRSVAWYTETLGLEHSSPWDGDPQLVGVGDTAVALFSGSGKALSDPQGMRHFAFRTDRENFDRAQEEFRQRGIDFQFEDHGVCHSVYIRDPDGYRVEITTYDV
jgi:catechol 2,3-dioxygenase-like lactoylglutathione lyase family enzyme